MAKESKTKCIGILTSGGDCPGLNAAIRSITKTAINEYDITVVGIRDGFRGLVENRTVPLDNNDVSGILTTGGTILGTSRDKPHKMPMGGKILDMRQVAVENIKRNHIDCLVCLGGGGTLKNSLRLHETGGVNVINLPKTIDNDVEGTDVSFGFDTAAQIATEAIDRLHTTATSHHRMIICEIMGHNTGWLTLRAGIAGGADVILIPEIPYNLNVIAEYLEERRRKGSRFSIIAVAEGARTIEEIDEINSIGKKKKKQKKDSEKTEDKPLTPEDIAKLDLTDGEKQLLIKQTESGEPTIRLVQEPIASRIARRLQEKTGIEARVTSLGHVQRGGIPSAFDRWLCTLLGSKTADLLAEGKYNVLVGYQDGICKTVPLKEVAGKKKTVPPDHPMIRSARLVGTCMGTKWPTP